jgi:hypothetical protein
MRVKLVDLSMKHFSYWNMVTDAQSYSSLIDHDRSDELYGVGTLKDRRRR